MSYLSDFFLISSCYILKQKIILSTSQPSPYFRSAKPFLPFLRYHFNESLILLTNLEIDCKVHSIRELSVRPSIVSFGRLEIYI